jgi:uncharacterized protein with PIN domain
MQQIQFDTVIVNSRIEARTCPHCESPLRLLDSVWNPETKGRARVWECMRCRKLEWDE